MAAHVAERLWCTPPGARFTDAARAMLDAGESLAFESGRGHVVAWSWGDGPLVLLVHGWGGHSGQLTPFVPALASAGFRVVAVDAPGHGRSSAGAMGPGRATLLDFRWALGLLTARLGRPYAVVAHSVGAAAVALGLTDAVGRRWQARLAARLGFRWEDLDMRATPERARTPPLLVVHDIGDRSTPWADGAAIVRRWPHAALHTTDGLGHRRLLEDAGVVQQVAAFLRDAAVSGPD